MKNVFLLLLYFCTSINILAQTNKDTLKSTYIGSGGRVIIVSDSLSFLDSFYPSEFYLIEESRVPYTGILLTNKKGIYIDTSQVLIGKKEGLSKGYLKEKGKYFLQHLSYINRDQKIYVSRFFSNTQKYNHALINYVDGKNEVRIIIYYKKRGKTVLLEKNGGKKIKHKFTNPSELNSFIDNISSNELPINAYCKIVQILESGVVSSQ